MMGMVTGIRTALVSLITLAVVQSVFIRYDKIAIKINKRRKFYFGTQVQTCGPLVSWTCCFEPVKPRVSGRGYIRDEAGRMWSYQSGYERR